MRMTSSARVSSLAIATFAAATLVAFIAAPAAAQEAARTPIGNSTATLTAAIRVGNIVYGGGQLGLSRTDPDTTISGQTRRALENVKRVFEEAGTTMDQAIRCTVFLVEASDFRAMNEVYRTFWPVSPPARSTVVVKALVVPSAKIEIECMAVMPQP